MGELMLEGRRALVTGSVQGIGLAIAQALARQGCAIVLHGLATDAQAQEARASVLGAGAPAVEVLTHNLRDADQVQQMMEAALASGPLDILVNNAGIQHTAALADMPRAKWDDIIAINLSAAFDTMRLALPQMAQRGYGRVVNIASVHGLVASVHKAPYVAAKFGMVGMSRVAALEYASAGTARAAASPSTASARAGPKPPSSSRRSMPARCSWAWTAKPQSATSCGTNSPAFAPHCPAR